MPALQETGQGNAPGEERLVGVGVGWRGGGVEPGDGGSPPSLLWVTLGKYLHVFDLLCPHL